MKQRKTAGKICRQFFLFYKTLILLQFFHQHLVDHARVRLSFGGLHDLAYQEAQGLFLAGLEVRDGLRVGGDYFIHHENATFLSETLEVGLRTEYGAVILDSASEQIKNLADEKFPEAVRICRFNSLSALPRSKEVAWTWITSGLPETRLAAMPA